MDFLVTSSCSFTVIHINTNHRGMDKYKLYQSSGHVRVNLRLRVGQISVDRIVYTPQLFKHLGFNT